MIHEANASMHSLYMSCAHAWWGLVMKLGTSHSDDCMMKRLYFRTIQCFLSKKNLLQTFINQIRSGLHDLSVVPIVRGQT